MELADRFEAGARANKGDPTSFRRNVNTFRGQASTLALHLRRCSASFRRQGRERAAGIRISDRQHEPAISADPGGDGVIPTTGDVAIAQKQNLERCVLLAAACATPARRTIPPKHRNS